MKVNKILGMPFVVFLILGSFICCDGENDPIPGLKTLDALLEEIEIMATSESCDDFNDWRFIGLGSKPCGGPTSYIAYSMNIDTNLFLSKVMDYNKGMEEYNRETGAVSDCAIIAQPAGVICEDGKPVLTYAID